jgi:nucleoside 2-deoxyribosyltransferase
MRGGPSSLYSMPRAYVAGPIFTPEQRGAVDSVTSCLEALGYVTYSPYRDGIMLQPTDPPERRDEVFQSNVWAIRSSDLLVALLDTKDTGTIWELGMANAGRLPVVAITLLEPKMNVMLERGVIAHARSIADLDNVCGELCQYLTYGRKVTNAFREAWRTLPVLPGPRCTAVNPWRSTPT